MKTKHLQFKSWLLMLVMLLGAGGNAWADTKTEGFESATTGTSYQGTVEVSREKSDCGISWAIYYGNVSTSSKITGNNSAALRLYKSTPDALGYLKTTTAIEGLSKVTFNAKASTSNSALIKINISYSSDGTTWTAIETDKVLTSSSAGYSVNIPSGGKYFQIAISSNSTKPSKDNAQLTIDDVVFTYSGSGDTPSTKTDIATLTSISPTTVAVDDSGKFTLDATFAEGTTEGTDYTVNWESSNASILEVNGNAYNAKAAGTAKVTVTVTPSEANTNTYNEVSKSFEITVNSKPITVNPKNVNSNYYTKVTSLDDLQDGDAILIVNEAGNVALSTTQNNNNRGQAAITISNNSISLIGDAQKLVLVNANNGWYFYTGESGFLCAASSSSNYLKTKVEADDNAKASIEITDGNATITFQGSYTRNILKYNSSSSLFSCYASGQDDVQIYKEVVKPEVVVSSPAFSLTEGACYESQSVTLSCATSGATIYYTTDGTEPTNASTAYTGAITISETTTLKAIAYVGEVASAVASATYTFPVTYDNIAALVKAAPTETAILNLTDAQVLYVNNKDMYVKDTTGAIDFYNCGLSYTAGKILNGTMAVTYTLYNNLPEIASVDTEHSSVTVTDGTANPIEMSAGDITLANDVCELVMVKGAYDKDKKTIDGLFVYDKWENNDIDLDAFEASIASAVGIVIPYKGDPEIALISIKSNPVVAQIGVTKYETLADAVAAVPIDGTATTIKMIADEEVLSEGNITIAAGKNIVLDLNGKTVSGTSGVTNSFYFLTNSGTLEITDNSVDASGKITYQSSAVESSYSKEFVTVYNLGGTLTLTNGTIENTSGGGLAYAVKNSSNAWGSDVISTFNMNGGKVSAPNGDAALRVYQNCAAGTVQSKNYVNITGGTIDATGIFVDETLYKVNIPSGYTGGNIDTKIVISGGTVNGLIDMKIRHPFNTLLNITGGNFTNTKIWVRKVANEYADVCGEPTAPMVTISGGTFDFAGENAFGLAHNYAATTWTSYDKPYAISGGVYDLSVDENYCAEGYIPTANTDEATKTTYPYTVKEGSYVAQVGDAKYETMADAVAAVTEENNTITLLADITDPYTLTAGQSLNINKDGHTITILAPEGYIVNEATSEEGMTSYTTVTPVAQIGDVKYASLADAIAAVPADGTATTITMIADESIAGNAGVTIASGMNVVLDLNGKTITGVFDQATTAQAIKNLGTLTITDSSEDQAGTLTIEVSDENAGSPMDKNWASNVIRNDGTLTVNAGNIVNAGTGGGCYAIDNYGSASLTVNGGKIDAAKASAIRMFYMDGGKLTVNDGLIGHYTSDDDYTYMGIQVQSGTNANVTLNGGTIVGNWALYNSSTDQSSITISGGTYDGYVGFGSAGPNNISITGGSFMYWVGTYGSQTKFISGGLFAEQVDKTLLADDYVLAENTDDATKEIYPYMVRMGQFIAQLGDDKFETLTEAIAAVTEENNTITLLADVSEPYTLSAGQSLNLNLNEHTISVLAPAGYTLNIATSEDGITTYTAVQIQLAAPVIFHDTGEYEGSLTVAIVGNGTIKYTLNDGTEQTYSAPITINETTTIKAWTESDGVKSKEVSKTFTIVAKPTGPTVDGFYTIMNNGDQKYVNVAGRKTVTFVDEAATETAPGTVIRVKATDGKVEVLRSQGVDLPGYAKKAMNYVPEIVQLVVDKLHAEGSGEILGENGLNLLMKKFNESFDYNLYLESVDGGYRIYGRTPSMKPVVDFYAENKDKVDTKLPQLEDFINSAIDKVLEKTGGRGKSILVDFSLETVWENMGGESSKLTKPVKGDDDAIANFYEKVLSSEENVWNFAYQAAMIYWNKLKDNDTFKNNLDKLGDYSKYIDKVDNIRPNFKYYIVQNSDAIDFYSEGNTMITGNDASTSWTLTPRSEFNVTFNADNKLKAGHEVYTTLYTDFAYTLPENVKAYKVTEINEKTGVAKREEITDTIPAQTPVLLMTTDTENLTQALTLSTTDGTAPTDNLLKGPDYLITEHQIITPQVETLFNLAKELLGESGYNSYVAKYEHLMLKNAGTVNNKYFFGLPADDLTGVTDLRILGLDNAGMNLGFHNIWTNVNANQAFIITNDYDPVKLSLKGDINRDGQISIADVTALVNIILGKATVENDSDKYDFDAAYVNSDNVISIADVTALVNIILGKN